MHLFEAYKTSLLKKKPKTLQKKKKNPADFSLSKLILYRAYTLCIDYCYTSALYQSSIRDFSACLKTFSKILVFWRWCIFPLTLKFSGHEVVKLQWFKFRKSLIAY